MFEFELDNSSFFDFKIKDNKQFVVKQGFVLPILEIVPIKTRNFDELVSLIQNAYVTFSMYDASNCYRILNKSAIINFDTPANEYNNQDDTCKNIVDFTIQYQFTENDISKEGVYRGEFKIVFSNNEEEKTLIVPILNSVNIIITPSNNKFKVKHLPTPEKTLTNSLLLDDGVSEYLIIDENTYLIFT